MNCTKCEDGFIRSQLLGRVQCLACRDTRIDRAESAVIEPAFPTQKECADSNPYGTMDYFRVYITQAGFASWDTVDGLYSHLTPPPKSAKLLEVIGESYVSEEYRAYHAWCWTESFKIGGHHMRIDVSHEFGPGALAHIDETWRVRLQCTPYTSSHFHLTANNAVAQRFRRAIKLPDHTNPQD